MKLKWQEIWADSRFWVDTSPADHFDTPSTLAGDLISRRLSSWLREFRCSAVIEIGVGNGQILPHIPKLHSETPCYGIDMRDSSYHGFDYVQQKWEVRTEKWLAPAGNPPLADWLAGFGEPILVFAIEWLDDLACEIAHRNSIGELTGLGPGGPIGSLSPDDHAWIDRWWPGTGAIAVGRNRDIAWAWLAARLPRGSVLVTIDYGHVRSSRPADAGFRAYLNGREVPPGPGANLTAAVAVDSLAAAVEELGWERLHLSRLADLPADFWSSDAPDPLTALALSSQETLLRHPTRFGGFWLVAHHLPAKRP